MSSGIKSVLSDTLVALEASLFSIGFSREVIFVTHFGWKERKKEKKVKALRDRSILKLCGVIF